MDRIRGWKRPGLALVMMGCLMLGALAEADEVIGTIGEGSRERELSKACQSHQSALTLLESLQPAPNAHLDSLAGSSINLANGGYGQGGLGASWRSVGKEFGIDVTQGPISKLLSLLSQLLQTLSTLLSLPTNLFRLLLSFLSLSPSPASPDGGLTAGTLGEKASRLMALLREATEPEEGEACPGAWGTRGLVALTPPQGVAQDLPLAYKSMKTLSEISPNSTAQFLMGFFHASGIGGADRDQAKALLHYTFAAVQGLPQAELALGYRHWAGIGVKEDCMTALGWYESAADKAYHHFLSGPPGGLTLPLTPTKLTDLAGGVFGPGASWSNTGFNAGRAAVKAVTSREGGERYDDVLEFYQFHSDRDNHRYTVILGRIYYLGSVYSLPGGLASGAEGVGAIPQSFSRARSYFLKTARAYWPTDPKLVQPGANGLSDGLPDGFNTRTGMREMSKEQEEELMGPAATSAGFLGRMYLRGEGVAQDFLVARMWLKRAADLGDREAHNMLGYVYRDGLGTKALHANLASKYFQAAAGQDHAESKIQLGKMHLDRQERDRAQVFFNQAIVLGNGFEAFYHLAKIHAANARGTETGTLDGTCGVAVSFFKVVAERGSWQYPVVEEAGKAWMRGERESALMGWWQAAEMGYEVAQNDVAYLLEPEKGFFDRNSAQPSTIGKVKEVVNDTDFMALTHWTRSAAQQNIDALVKVGDYYFEGIGVAPHENRFEKAAAWYQSAADTQASAIAFWNLGWMYENGLGVPQDWHLAKRYYDLCRETNTEAYLPVIMSLIKLHIRSWWSSISGGKQKRLKFFGRDDEDGDVAVSKGDVKTLKPRRQRGRRAPTGVPGGDDQVHEPRVGGGGEDENDVVEWARMRERDADLRTGDDDYDDLTGGDGRFDADRETHMLDAEEELAETILIGMIIIGLTSLFYLRSRWVRRRREAEEADARRRGVPLPPVQIPIDFAPMPI